MRALFRQSDKNSFTILDIVEQKPLGKWEILVKIKASSLTFTSNKAEKLFYTKVENRPVGSEFSGVVVKCGAEVSARTVTEEVVGIIPINYKVSGCAEYVVVNEYDVVRKPGGVSYVDAAGVVGDGLRSYIALNYMGKIASGDTVLVTNGASAFGSLLIQLAHLWNSKVVTIAHSEDEKLYLDSLAKDTGAQVINSKHKSLDCLCQELKTATDNYGFDIIIDSSISRFENLTGLSEKDESKPEKAGILANERLISLLAVGGRWITEQIDLQLDPPASRHLFLKCASLNFLFSQAWILANSQQGKYQHILYDIMERLANGTLKSNIHHTVAFDSSIEALQRMDEVKVGNVVMVNNDK